MFCLDCSSVFVNHSQFPESSHASSELGSFAAAPATPFSSQRTATEVCHNGLRRLRFMVVDDTTTSRKVTRRLLCSLGHSVEEAVDGLDFLHKIGISHCGNNSNLAGRGSDWVVRHEDFKMVGESFAEVDVILMDDNMPNLSGPEATALLRHCGYTGIVFGVTGNAFDSQVENFLAKGANKVFSKPLDLRLLEEEIRANLA
jgi:CheY-like chemotaxis protein